MGNQMPTFMTIFDRNESQWGDSLLIQEFKGRVFKFLDLSIENLEKYIEITNHLDELKIVINKQFNNDELDIKEVQVSFNSIDTGVYPASVITGIGKGYSGLNVVTSKYVEGKTLWELGCFNKATRVKGDLQDYIASICEYIESSLTYTVFDKEVSFLHQISPVNIKITSLKDGILILVVTDIGSSIGKMIHR